MEIKVVTGCIICFFIVLLLSASSPAAAVETSLLKAGEIRAVNITEDKKPEKSDRKKPSKMKKKMVNSSKKDAEKAASAKKDVIPPQGDKDPELDKKAVPKNKKAGTQ
jgi:hypothetical protein